jgi:hypothetical protein
MANRRPSQMKLWGALPSYRRQALRVRLVLDDFAESFECWIEQERKAESRGVTHLRGVPAVGRADSPAPGSRSWRRHWVHHWQLRQGAASGVYIRRQRAVVEWP